MCKPNATITAASRPFLYDFTVTRGSEPVPYRAFLHEWCRYPQSDGLSVPPPELLAHISPLGWAHFLLTGGYR